MRSCGLVWFCFADKLVFYRLDRPSLPPNFIGGIRMRNRRFAFTFFLAIATLATGCKRVHDSYREMGSDNFPVTVIGPHFSALVDGKLIPVIGRDECPRNSGVMALLFGPGNAGSRHDCIILAPGATHVEVLLATESGIVNEIWEIVAERAPPGELTGERFLRRPNGAAVILVRHPN